MAEKSPCAGKTNVVDDRGRELADESRALNRNNASVTRQEIKGTSLAEACLMIPIVRGQEIGTDHGLYNSISQYLGHNCAIKALEQSRVREDIRVK